MTSADSERIRDSGAATAGRLQLAGFRRGADQRRSLSLAGVAGWYASGRTAAVALVTVLVWIGFDLFNSSFLSAENMAGLIDQIVPVGVLSVGMAIVLLAGEIDLSSAAVGGVAATLAARLAVGDGMPVGIALLIGLACAVLHQILVLTHMLHYGSQLAANFYGAILGFCVTTAATLWIGSVRSGTEEGEVATRPVSEERRTAIRWPAVLAGACLAGLFLLFNAIFW